MKQVVQNYKTGELRVDDVPVPICRSGGVLVRTAYSLVSAGTERMKVSQARMNLVQMAKARPDKVKQVIQSVKQVGLSETMNKVRERLDSLTPLGYSLAGVVEEVGPGLDEFAVGDRVACAGEGIACHAEFAAVPKNLCVHVPENVSLGDAAFSTVGSIAMNGVRQAGVSLGDNVLVVGLGLVGLLGVQILKAAGCRVIGVDLDAQKIELARACGADYAFARSTEGLREIIAGATGGVGVDAAYIAASTKSSDPMELAGQVLRDRGTVAIVGMVPVEADWQTYYEKELNVVMSRSYGPGRYDRNYELKGVDYPIGYVRWTQRRNLQSFLDLIAAGKVQPNSLKPHIFALEDAPDAYGELHENPGKHAVGILFKYSETAKLDRSMDVAAANPNGRHRASVSSTGMKKSTAAAGPIGIGVIGAGNFCTATLIPALKKIDGINLRSICSASGLTAKSAARRHGFTQCASDYRELLDDASIQAVVIATHHDTHARFTVDALRAGKHVFVEKPLALDEVQLAEVVAAQAESGLIAMPGFNRRFAKLAADVRQFFAQRTSPMEIILRVNAGEIKADSWYQDAEEGGWRIISEGCHFVDLIQYLCGCSPERVSADMIGGTVGGKQNDNCICTLRMDDGSIASLSYLANGDSSFPKERVEVFGQGRTALIDNWRVAELYGGGKCRKTKPAGTAKGHSAEMAAFVEAIRTGQPSPLPFADAVRTTEATFAIARSLRSGQPETVGACGDVPAAEAVLAE